MARGLKMECPNCGTKVGGVGLVVGFVKITTFKCQCGRVWRLKGLLCTFQVAAFAQEIDRLHSKHPGAKPVHVRIAIEYLQAKLDDHQYSALAKEEALRKKKADLWERNFLKEALGDDF